MDFSCQERRVITRAARRRIAGAKTIPLEALPCLAVSEVVDEAVTLAKLVAIVHGQPRDGLELDVMRGRLMAAMDYRLFRTRAAKIIGECEATTELLERGL